MLENIGEVNCPFHENPMTAYVRRNKNSRLYFHCPECGPIQTHGGSAVVDWILTNATMYGAKEKTNDNPTNSRTESRVHG